MGKVLSVLMPKAGVLGLDANSVSKDPDVVDAYVNDPLVFHGKTPARLAAEILNTMLYNSTQFGRLTLPMIIIQGKEDQLVDAEGAQMVYDRAGSTDKTLKIYEGLHHEIFNEPEREMVLKDVENWLDAHV